MRPPPPLLSLLSLLSLPLLLLGGRSAAATPADSLPQLPAPRDPKILLYNAKQVLSWDPVSLGNDSRPVVYQVQYKLRGAAGSKATLTIFGSELRTAVTVNGSSGMWYDVKSTGVNCMNITTPECDFSPNSNSVLWEPEWEISLRVRAKVEDLVSPWLTVPSFRYCWNVTIGPPRNIWVTPGEGSLIIRFSSPFDIHAHWPHFLYYVHYWEKAGIQQVKGPFRSTSIELNDLKPLREYCLQVKAHLVCKKSNVFRPGPLSDVSCYQTTMDATTKLQQVIMIAVGLFVFLSMLAAACFFLVLKYRGLVKYWFHSPPSIPLQIEEYLKDPTQPILEALDKDSSPKDDAWDSVSIVSFPEKEQEDVLQSTLNQSAGPVQQPVG